MITSKLNDRYRLDAEIGQGGMGKVYRGYDPVLDRDVAVKILSKSDLGTEGSNRLLNEAQMVAKLSHPGIVTVHDAGESGDLPFIVMEFVEGITLFEHRPENMEEILSITRQVCNALEHAHANGIIHRDLKPENVVITEDGTAKLMDFGMARSVVSRLTSEGTIVGTVFYMAPEQAMGQAFDARVDLYALGVMLYELTTGELPFMADDPVAVISQHIHAPVVPPRAKNEDLPHAFNDLILLLMNKDPDDRPPSASAVLEILNQPEILDKDTIPTREVSVLDRIVRGRMVGRGEEYQQIRNLWNKALTGRGQTILISGEPGIGKTRLIREAITHAEVSGGQTLVGECYAESNLPYNAFGQVVRKALNRTNQNGFHLPDLVLADLLTLVPDLIHHYPDLPTIPKLDPESEQQRLFEHMVTFCKALAEQAPLLLVVDDVHWADSGTLAMLHHIIRRVRKQHMMVVAAYREVELREARPFNEMLLELNRQRLCTRLKLNRLDPNQARDMLTAIFAEEITTDFLTGIYQETDGNPFFIEEVCRALVESGRVYFGGGQWHRPSMEELEIPQGIQVAVESRLEKLPEDYQETLRMAAVLGREFDFGVLLEALDVDEDTLIEALETAEESHMIQEVDGRGEVTFAFVHALVPSAIVESVRTLRRRKLHRRAAKAFEALHPTNYEALAYHHSEGGDDQKALKYHTLAGERALEAFSNQDAENHFLSALDLVEEQGEQAHLLVQLGVSQSRQSKFGEAVKTWRQTISLYQMLGDLDCVADLYARCGRAASEDGDTKKGLEICREGLAAVEGEEETPGFAHLLAETSRACYFSGLPDESEKHGQKALKMAESMKLIPVQADVLSTLALLPLRSDEEWISMQQRAIELAESANLHRQAMRAHNNLAVAYGWVSVDLPKCIHHLHRAAELAHQIGVAENELFFRVNVCRWHLIQGEIKYVEEQLPILDELVDSIPDPGAGGANLLLLKADLLFYQGRFDQALELLEDIARKRRDAGDLQSLSEALLTIIQIGMETGDLEMVKRTLPELIEIAERGMGSKSISLTYASVTYSMGGEIQKARDLLERANQAATNSPSQRLDQIFLKWGQAQLHSAERNWESAWRAYNQAASNLKEFNLCLYRAILLKYWAQAHLSRGEYEDTLRAKELFQEAQAEFEQMGAEGFVTMLKKQLADIGAES
jgi:tetratricopeptide (TPR) repeat protein